MMIQLGREAIQCEWGEPAGNSASFLAEYDGVDFTGYQVTARFQTRDTILELKSFGVNPRITITPTAPSATPNTIAFLLTVAEVASLAGGGVFQIWFQVGGDVWMHYDGVTHFAH